MELLLCLRSTVLIIDRLNKVDDIVSIDSGGSSVVSLMDGVKIGITQTLLSGPVCVFIVLLRVQHSHPLRRLFLGHWQLLDEPNLVTGELFRIHVLLFARSLNNLSQVRSADNIR